MRRLFVLLSWEWQNMNSAAAEVVLVLLVNRLLWSGVSLVLISETGR